VRSIVGRFLEHSRIYRFENGGDPKIYLGSADWTARNFFRRVEVCFPVEDVELCRRLDKVIATYWGDNVKAREQGMEPAYARRPLKGEPVNAQMIFLEQSRKSGKTDVDVRSRAVKTKADARAMEQKQALGQPA
jgi:polyphosphate kinase